MSERASKENEKEREMAGGTRVTKRERERYESREAGEERGWMMLEGRVARTAATSKKSQRGEREQRCYE